MPRPRFILHIILLLASALTAPAASADTPAWEQVKKETPGAKSVIKDQDMEILVSPGEITVHCSKPTQIKIFTILGRVVSTETVPAGISRLPITVHGVYIVTVGERTCKVAL